MEIETEEDIDKYDLHAFHKGIDGGPRWEVSHNVVCDQCEEENASVDVSGELIVLTCHSCDNWHKDSLSNVLWTDKDSGEIRSSDWDMPFTLTGRANRW